MQVSDLFIRRPVFAVVVSLLLIVGGLASLINMPVREYPQVDRPVVSVSTIYRGASNEVIESRVTEIIEGAVAGIEGIRQISSQSQNDRSSVSIEFEVFRDPEAATSDVRDAVSRIAGRPARRRRNARGPQGRRQRLRHHVGRRHVLDARCARAQRLSCKRVYVDRLSTVPGVANVYLGGERRYAMRIWVDRSALAARGLTVQDIETAIKRQNVELPGGRIESAQRELTVKTDSRLATPGAVRTGHRHEQERLPRAPRRGGPRRGRREDTRFEFYQSGRNAIGLGIVRQSTANTLSVADDVRRELEELKPSLPPGTDRGDPLRREPVHPRLDRRRAAYPRRGHRPRHPGDPHLPARLALDDRRHGRRSPSPSSPPSW